MPILTTNRHLKQVTALVFLVLLAGFGVWLFKPVKASAQTSSYAANITVDGSLDVLINGQQNAGDYAADNDTVNVDFSNNAGSSILVCIKGSSPVSIANSSSDTIPITVNAEAEADVTLSSGDSCMSGAGNPGYLYIEGATGSLSCSVFNAKDWNITGQYSYVPSNIYLYRGSTYVANIQSDKGAGQYYNAATVNEEFAGESSAATYYIYDEQVTPMS